jgi:hypothetical protein
MKARTHAKRSTANGKEERVVVAHLVLRHAQLVEELAKLEAEKAEDRAITERLRAAELAAPRKQQIYFRLARLLRASERLVRIGSAPSREVLDIVFSCLRTPENLRKTANAVEIGESDVDRAGLKVVKSYLAAAKKHYLAALERQKQDGEERDSRAALRESNTKLKLEDVAREYKEKYPGHRVPDLRSLGRTLKRKELWSGKPGRPLENKNVARLVARSLDNAM